MNALVGQEAKANRALVWRRCQQVPLDGASEDGGDLRGPLGRGHGLGRRQLRWVHDGLKGFENRHGW